MTAGGLAVVIIAQRNAGERRDVVAPLAERRQLDRDDVDA